VLATHPERSRFPVRRRNRHGPIDLFEAGETLARVPATQDAADRAVVRLLSR